MNVSTSSTHTEGYIEGQSMLTLPLTHTDGHIDTHSVYKHFHTHVPNSEESAK